MEYSWVDAGHAAAGRRCMVAFVADIYAKIIYLCVYKPVYHKKSA
jgi:hypothetical protein